MRHVARSMAAHRRLLHDLPRKSSTCFGRATGQALTEYETRDAAEEGALHAGARSGSNWLAPYLCSSCGMWHLAPTHSVRRAPTPCVCVSGSGKVNMLHTFLVAFADCALCAVLTLAAQSSLCGLGGCTEAMRSNQGGHRVARGRLRVRPWPWVSSHQAQILRHHRRGSSNDIIAKIAWHQLFVTS